MRVIGGIMVLCTEGEGACLPLLVLSKENLSVCKEILFLMDCQGLSDKERWHCGAMTERLEEMNLSVRR